MIAQIEGAHALDGRSDLLPVCADVLHRRSAHRAGNSRQALDARAVFLNGALNEGVPILACSDAIDGLRPDSSVTVTPRNPTCNTSPSESRIGNEQVAAAAQHKQRKLAIPRPARPLRQSPLRCGPSTNQRAGPPMPKVVKGASELVFFKEHRDKGYTTGFNDRMDDRQLSLPEGTMYPELMVIPMREELVRAGIKETRPPKRSTRPWPSRAQPCWW